MRILSRGLIVAVVTTLVVSSTATAPLPAISIAGGAALSGFLGASVVRGDAPAVVALVANRDAVLYAGAFGKRSVARNVDVTPDTIFNVASMTKPVTSLAAMMLYEEGKIRLDDSVATYLPGFRQPPVLARLHPAEGRFDGRPARRPITVRDLLTNTSGIGYTFLNPVLAALNQAGAPEDELPLLHEPGAKWTYGPNTAIVGRIVEQVSGQTLDTFFAKRIFNPLAMHDTFYVVPPDKRDRVATEHVRSAGGTTTERPNWTLESTIRGDGGLFSTARDYATLLRLFLNGGRHGSTRLVSERTIRLMMSNQMGRLVVERQASADTTLAMPFPFGAGKDKFGFGFQIETAPSEKGMRSVGSVSWGGVFNTHFWIDPQKQIAAVVLMQVLPYYDEKCVSILHGFERLVYQQLR